MYVKPVFVQSEQNFILQSSVFICSSLIWSEDFSILMISAFCFVCLYVCRFLSFCDFYCVEWLIHWCHGLSIGPTT